MTKKKKKKKTTKKAEAKENPWAAGSQAMIDEMVDRSLNSITENAFDHLQNDATLIVAFSLDDHDVMAAGDTCGFSLVARSGGGDGSIEERIKWLPWEVVTRLVKLHEAVESMCGQAAPRTVPD